MPKIFEVYNKALAEGKDKGVLSNDVRILIALDNGFKEPIDTLFHRDSEMKNLPLFETQFKRLLQGEPVEYIAETASFLEFKLHVDKRVLIPRMETQELVAKISETISSYFDPRNFLVCADIGTGSGAIAIALKSLFPNWLVSASDVSAAALEVARENAHKYNFPISFLEGDALSPYIKEKMNLDIIVSNPPYILNKDEVQDSVKNYEPGLSLWLDKNDSVYEKIFKDVGKVKRGEMLLCFEVGYDLEEYLIGLMGKYLNDFEYKFEKDLNELTRFLFVHLR
jgi:release factor glutamine methyltransferase